MFSTITPSQPLISHAEFTYIILHAEPIAMPWMEMHQMQALHSVSTFRSGTSFI